MEISIFEVLGPVMIGPSSSHTAGAARLARVAAEICAKPFSKVRFGLSGSFAKTGLGHGTHMALLAGALGFSSDDERLRDARRYARDYGVQVEYTTEELTLKHENSVHITFFCEDGSISEIWGSSVGGGRVEVARIDGFETLYYAESPALLVHHLDRPGVISEVSRALAGAGINIAVLRLSREARGRQASALFIVDSPVTEQVAAEIGCQPNIGEVRVINVS